MFRFNRTIIRLNTRYSIGTFSECLLYGIPYCLQCIDIIDHLVLLANIFKNKYTIKTPVTHRRFYF